MKKSIFMMAALLFAVACGGNNTANSDDHAERIDEITANAKEGFNRGADKVGEIAKEVDRAIIDGAEQVEQRAKASMERNEEHFEKVKIEVKSAANTVKEKSLEIGSELVVKGAEAVGDASDEVVRRVRKSVDE